MATGQISEWKDLEGAVAKPVRKRGHGKGAGGLRVQEDARLLVHFGRWTGKQCSTSLTLANDTPGNCGVFFCFEMSRTVLCTCCPNSVGTD